MKSDGVSNRDAEAFLLAYDERKEKKSDAGSNSNNAAAALKAKLQAQQKGDGVAGAPNAAIQDDPKYQPYLKMLKMGIPPPAVKHKASSNYN